VSSIAVLDRPRLALRPLALPTEHGGWGFLFEPIVLALLVAPSLGGALIGAGAIAVFLMRHPLKLAAQDRMRGKRYPRTGACETLALSYALVATAAFGAATYVAGGRPLIALGAALPFAALQFAHDARNRGRQIVAEVAGAIAPGSLAAAIALAAKWPEASSLALWALVAARAVPSILYVRSLLRGGRRSTVLLAHIGAAASAAGLWAAGLTPASGILAMLVLLSRARQVSLTARRIGMRELGYGALTVAVIAAGYSL
jgi:hypothetical protein